MDFEILLGLVVFPMLLGGALMIGAMFLKAQAGVMSGLFAAAILALLVNIEGPPPFPPISAKHKLPYILLAIAVAALGAQRLGRRGRVIAACAILLGALAWLLQRQLLAGSLQLGWLTPLAAIPILAAAIYQQGRGSPSRFAWPVTLLGAAIAASFVSLLGGFIGVGQALAAVSACLGGAVFVLFIAAMREGAPPEALIAPPVLWAVTTALGVLLLALGAYATNLSAPAYFFTLAIMAAPMSAQWIAPRPLWLQPILFAALAAIPAGPALLLAAVNF